MAFAVGNKGYVGTGSFFEETDNGTIYIRYKDLWQFDTASNLWTNKADFPVGERFSATGFSVADKGYLALGYDVVSGTTKKDIWQYDPATNTWLQRADFPGTGSSRLVSFTTNNKAYMGVGSYTNDFWEYTPPFVTEDTCAVPYTLKVLQLTDTAVLLGWSVPVDTVNGYRIRYISTSGKDVHRRTVNGSTNHVLIHGLLPGTTYKWQMKSFCATDTSAWITGPAFTTKISSAITANINNDLQTTTGLIKVIPNPNNGVFVLQMQLPGKRIPTSITLYNAEGKRAWQHDLGSINGYINYQVNIEIKLAAGVYTLRVERSDLQLTQKLIINK